MDLGYRTCYILGVLLYLVKWYWFRGIDALVLSCCGGFGICLFFLNVMPERLALFVLSIVEKLGEKIGHKEIWVGIYKTVEVWMKFISSRAELEMEIFLLFEILIYLKSGSFSFCFVLFSLGKRKKFLIFSKTLFSL